MQNYSLRLWRATAVDHVIACYILLLCTYKHFAGHVLDCTGIDYNKLE